MCPVRGLKIKAEVKTDPFLYKNVCDLKNVIELGGDVSLSRTVLSTLLTFT